MPGPLTFDFITDEELRGSLDGDYRELQACFEQGAWKAVHVLAGGIIEAVLVDYLVVSGQTKPDPLKMTLADLIQACRTAGVLSEKTAELSSALKSYRNLIHPGRAKRLGESVDMDGALVAKSLVSIIVREVAEKQQEQHGLTAEQIITKFEGDASALGIAEHLLKDARDLEIERLLTTVLPGRYFTELQEEYPDTAILDGHSRLFRAAFNMASEEVKRKVMARYVSVLKEEPGSRVFVYEEQFFTTFDLQYVEEKELALVKDHLLSRIQSEPTARLIAVSEGIGEWLDEKDVQTFVDSFIRVIIFGRDQGLAQQARERLEGEVTHTSAALDEKIIERLENWVGAFEAREQADRASTVQAIKAAYEAYQDIPF